MPTTRQKYQRFIRCGSAKPVVRLASYGVAAVEPGMFGLGPVPGVRKALERARSKLRDVERIEINEAFAAVPLAVAQELGLAEDIINVEGGAIAHGHPIGATGACSRRGSFTPCDVMVSSAASSRCASAVAKASRLPSRHWRSQL